MEPKPPKPPRKPPKKRELADWLGRAAPREIGEPEWHALLGLLAPISEGYLRRLLRDSGVPLTPLVEGVRQETLDTLESSLITLLAEYESGNAARRAQVRRVVIAAKEHARFAARRKPQKEEMVLWLLTWLENPAVFPQWVRLRRTVLDTVEGL